ncbi:MAG TPA: nucleoside-diphosphate sugar epimerase/dehydratase [Thermoanaerobaculia bacterium]|nr:nucleoside-diphosphate sugar epimerase/dehydratase [Thermoanaerobaculia bacterium]
MTALRVAVLAFFHAIVFTGCYALAFLLRFDFQIPVAFTQYAVVTLPLVVAVQLVTGIFFKFYRGWWRYVGMTDVLRLVFGLTTATVLLFGIWYGASFASLDALMLHPPRTVLVIDWAFTVLTLFGARVLVRVSRDHFRGEQPADSTTNVLIVGAGDAGEALAREIEHRPQLGMKVVAFVDDQRVKWGSLIRGIQVRGPISNVGRIADETGAEEALIAIPSASGKRIREIIHHLATADLRFKTIPGMDQLVSGKVHVTQLRPVDVEDLLRRARVDLPGDPVSKMFRGKRVIVTGAGGTIGSELCAQILQFEPELLVLAERSEYALYESRKRLSRDVPWAASKIQNALVDVQQTSTMRHLIDNVQPHIVLHAAAHKHVPLGEENPPEYVRNNTLATRVLAEICEAAGVERFVLISTDKAINPSSVMGATKRAAEIVLLDVAKRSSMKVAVVRFGNVIGSSGSVIPLFMEQIARGGPITVTHPEVTRYFLRTSEAVSLVLQAATLAKQGEIFMLDMGEPVKIVDLARDLIRLSNHAEDEIPIVFTGLRQGEKLFEEIRLRAESVRPTVHPQIVVTAAAQPDAAMVERWIARMRAACEAGGGAVVPVLSEFIPEYTIAEVHRQSRPSSAAAQFLETGMIPVLKESKIVTAT